MGDPTFSAINNNKYIFFYIFLYSQCTHSFNVVTYFLVNNDVNRFMLIVRVFSTNGNGL